MDMVIATNNLHKVKELKAIFKDHNLHMPAEYRIDFHYKETGKTFFENALGKAEALYNLLGDRGVDYPVIADDSGLVVPVLGGEPGIMSARYGSEEKNKKLSDREKIDFLLSRLNKVSKSVRNRNAYFVCSMVLVAGKDRFFAAQETFYGEIALKPAGTCGFGYDPVFFIPSLNKTVAQLDEEEKNKISHRALAGRRILALLKTDLLPFRFPY